jgi:hypothetical protein
MAASTTVTIGPVDITTNPDGTVTTTKKKKTINAGKQRELLTEYAKAQRFKIKCHGLKPSTVHLFTFGGTDYTYACKQTHGLGGAKKLGAGLCSGKEGRLYFHFYFPKVIDVLDVTDVVQFEQAKAFATSPMVALVSSADGSSQASFTVTSSVKKGLEKWFDTWTVSTGEGD